MTDRPHDWDALRKLAADDPSALTRANMTPWMCEYQGAGKLYSIDLYGADPEQVWLANKDDLPGLRIIGVLHGREGA